MNLLIDIGNTHTALALASPDRIARTIKFPTKDWRTGRSESHIHVFTDNSSVQKVLCCSVVPSVTQKAKLLFAGKKLRFDQLTSRNCGLDIDYPKPKTIGADRLANAIGAIEEFGEPVIVVDFGTAVTFDIINKHGAYMGGVIAPGLSAMTNYLHERTALLPRIEVRKPRRIIGKSTEEAMQIGAIYGYQSMIQGLLRKIYQSLKSKSVFTVATGGDSELVCKGAPEFDALRPFLTLDGLRLASSRMN